MLRVCRGIASAFVALALGSCAAEQEPLATSTPDATTQATPSSTSSATTIEITVEGGEVVGGDQRHDVELGADVVLVVTADVSDEVHVHGYDLKADVDPGTPAEIAFTADVAGIYVVELEERHLKIAELAVR